MALKTTTDFATGKAIQADKAEEKVRQEYERVLVHDYGYRKSEIDIEVPIPRGSSQKDRADVVVYAAAKGRDPSADILGIIETKRPGDTSGKAQLKSYMTATSAVWGVWTNGDSIEYFCKPYGQTAVSEGYLNNIPSRGQRVEDVGNHKKSELKPYGRVELKLAFRRILNTLYANTTISRREKLGNEMIKLIFAKIRDETTYPNRVPAFRVGYGEDPESVKERIVALFRDSVRDLSHDGVFDQRDTITLDAKGVAWVVGQLERGSLVETPTDVVGDAFEVFAESKLVGEKGEFFTPRGVIDLAVKLTDPQPEQTVCDPACGSGGFLIATMRHIWQSMENDPKWKNLPELQLQSAKHQIASRCFFGIDKESDLVRIAKAYMAISGDGRSNIVHENALHEVADFNDIARQRFMENGKFEQFDFILTNPPYGTKTKVLKNEAQNFELGHKWSLKNGEWVKGKPRETDPYVLFVERCFDMLKDGGTLAIVLPETVFHAPTTAYLRHYMAKQGDVVAVIGLPHNTFRPHCNAKTCLLVMKKGTGRRDERQTVIMAAPKEMGHNHQGKEMYRPGTLDVWNDLPVVLKELDDPSDSENAFVFTVPWKKIEATGHLIPHYYAYRRKPKLPPPGQKWVRLGDLVAEEVIVAWDGHGSPSSAEKGEGDIPYIRVADIVNWELYRNPTSGVTLETYEKLTRGKPRVKAGDVIFVRRGSYRIGTVAMASERDEMVVLTRELLTLRVQDNDYGFTPHYLLALMSSQLVQDQIESLVFIDTTLPNIGDRWRELLLPVYLKRNEIGELSARVSSAIKKKWAAQREIQGLRDDIGGLVT